MSILPLDIHITIIYNHNMTTIKDYLRDLAIEVNEKPEKLSDDDIELLVDEYIGYIITRIVGGEL